MTESSSTTRGPGSATLGAKAGQAARRALGRALASRAKDAIAPRDVDALVHMEAEDGQGWSLRITGGTIDLSPGLSGEPAVRILSDTDTITEVTAGRRSGVEAFLNGHLRVRGNLALALRLDSLLTPEGRPARWPAWRTAKAGRIHTSYLEAGAGPPVVLLHGLGATNASFLPTLWDLAADHRVIAPDLPGFGDSGKPVRAYNARFFAGWLERFLDQVGVDRTHIIGNSMGGRVAIEAGLELPDRVDRLVLLMPAPAFIRYRQFVKVVRVLRPELALVPVPISHRQVVRNIRWMFSRPSRLPMAWYEAAADEFLRVFRSPQGRIAFFSAARQIYLEEPHGERGFWDRLPALSRPSLFVWGARDRLVPARFARHVEQALPQARSVVLEDCGHVPQYEMPEATHHLVREFLANGDGVRGGVGRRAARP